MDFGLPYKRTAHHKRELHEATITKNLEILDVYQKIHVDPTNELRLVSQRLWAYEFINPFPLTDGRRYTLHQLSTWISLFPFPVLLRLTLAHSEAAGGDVHGRCVRTVRHLRNVPVRAAQPVLAQPSRRRMP